jgi:hypothetical protein
VVGKFAPLDEEPEEPRLLVPHQGGVEDERLTPEEELIENEGETLDGLFEALGYMEQKTDTFPVRIEGKLKFRVEFHPIGEPTRDRARKIASKVKNLSSTDDVNISLMRSVIIYEATTDRSKAKTWDRPDMLAKYGLKPGMGYKVIDELPMGIKDRMLAFVEELSLATDDEERQTEISKN